VSRPAFHVVLLNFPANWHRICIFLSHFPLNFIEEMNWLNPAQNRMVLMVPMNTVSSLEPYFRAASSFRSVRLLNTTDTNWLIFMMCYDGASEGHLRLVHQLTGNQQQYTYVSRAKLWVGNSTSGIRCRALKVCVVINLYGTNCIVILRTGIAQSI
jgi:hypothetical protein